MKVKVHCHKHNLSQLFITEIVEKLSRQKEKENTFEKYPTQNQLS